MRNRSHHRHCRCRSFCIRERWGPFFESVRVALRLRPARNFAPATIDWGSTPVDAFTIRMFHRHRAAPADALLARRDAGRGLAGHGPAEGTAMRPFWVR